MIRLIDAIVFQAKFQEAPVYEMQGNRRGFLLDNISNLINVSAEAREKLTRLLMADSWRL